MAFIARTGALIALYLAGTVAYAQVTAGEWFVGTDPGQGQGNPISWDATDTVHWANSLNAQLPAGMHTVGLRVRDALGQWSHTQVRHVNVRPSAGPTPLVAGEWFVGTDPGQGQGNPISWDATDTVHWANSLNAQLPAGMHTVGLRVRDALGQWSHTQVRHVNVRPSAGPTPLVAGEWFVGTDPGQGQGNPISWDAADTVHWANSLNAQLPAGMHTVGLRVRDALGQWSHTQVRHVNVRPSAGPTPLVATEWFMDEDPGFGQGEPVAFPPTDTLLGLDIPVTIDDAGPVFRWLGIRVRDEAGLWGHTRMRPVSVRSGHAGVITAAEWFVDDDPGFGAGQPIDVGAPAPAITDLVFAASTAGLEPGDHVIFVRVFNDAGIPSHTWPVAFTMLEESGVGELLGGHLRVGPNPTMGELVLRTEKPIHGVELHLLDMHGRTVLQTVFNGDHLQLDLGPLAAGTYHLILSGNDGRHHVLPVVKH